MVCNIGDYDIIQAQKCKVCDGQMLPILKVERKVLTGRDMLIEFMSPWVAISWTVTTKLYRTALIEHYRFPELQLWDDYIFNRAILFDNPKVKVLTLPDIGYYYFMREDSIMHSYVTEKHMRSFDAVIDSTPIAILKNNDYKSWHEYFIYELAFGYLLSISKFHKEIEQYPKYVSFLKKNFYSVLCNRHLNTKRKLAMLAFAVCPYICMRIRELKNHINSA